MTCSCRGEGGAGGGGRSVDNVVGPDTHISDRQSPDIGMTMVKTESPSQGHMQHHTRALQCLIMQNSCTEQ